MVDTRRSQAIAIGSGLAVFVVSAGLAWNARVSGIEKDVFAWINGWPGWISGPLWPFMQFGMAIAPFVAGGLAWHLTRQRQPALGLIITGFTMWVLAKVVKEVVGRPRPGQLLDGVIYRADGGESGLGFVSGHAVVGFVIATIASPYVGKRWATVLWGIATAAATLRIYVGAHLPLDSIGGAGLGIAAGATTLFIIRRR